MFGISIYEGIVVLIVALVLFKPKDFSHILYKLGQLVRKVKDFTNNIQREVEDYTVMGSPEDHIVLPRSKSNGSDYSQIKKKVATPVDTGKLVQLESGEVNSSSVNSVEHSVFNEYPPHHLSTSTILAHTKLVSQQNLRDKDHLHFTSFFPQDESQPPFIKSTFTKSKDLNCGAKRVVYVSVGKRSVGTRVRMFNPYIKLFNGLNPSCERLTKKVLHTYLTPYNGDLRRHQNETLPKKYPYLRSLQGVSKYNRTVSSPAIIQKVTFSFGPYTSLQNADEHHNGWHNTNFHNTDLRNADWHDTDPHNASSHGVGLYNVNPRNTGSQNTNRTISNSAKVREGC